MSDQNYDNEVEMNDVDLDLNEADAKRPADRTGGDTSVVKQGSSDEKTPETKMGMINAMMQKMNAMKKADLKASYDKMLKAMNDMEDDDDDDDDMEMEGMHGDKKKLNAAMMKKMKEAMNGKKKMTKEDIDISADIEAIFGSDESLSEEFKTTASQLFETAVISTVNTKLEEMTGDLEHVVAEEVETAKQDISDKLNEYLDYVVEQFMSQNELAIERGIRAEIAEDFLAGLKDLFTEHYVDIPEEKVDVVEDLATKVDELEENLDEAVNYSIAIQKELVEYKKAAVIEGMTDDLADTQVEKLKSLAEGIDYEDDEQFREKLAFVKETYFPNETTVRDDEQIDESSDGIDTSGMSDTMARYMTHISQLKTNK